MTSQRLNDIYRELRANAGMAVSRMYNDRWSFTGCAHADGFWLTTSEVRQLWVGGMLKEVSDWADDSRFSYGVFQYDPNYHVPAYLADFDHQPCWIN